MILAFGSAVHGRDGKDYIPWLGKLVVASTTALIYAFVGLLVAGIWGVAVGLLAALWWALFRRSWQAHAEMQKMDTNRYPSATYANVMKAHYYTGFLTCIGLWLFNYSSPLGKKLGWEEKLVAERKVPADADGRALPGTMPFWDCRRPTEFLTGLTGDIMLASILITIA